MAGPAVNIGGKSARFFIGRVPAAELLSLVVLKRLYIITVFEEAVMTPRIICPHCHSPIDPLTLEVAESAEAHYRICPECDEPIVMSVGDSSHAFRNETFPDQEPVWV